MSNDELKSDKEEYNSKITSLSYIFDIIGDDKFIGLIEDVDSFQETINMCKLDAEEVNVILNVAIKSNLEFLDSNGVVIDNIDSDMMQENSIIQDKISDLSNLLGNE